MIHNGWEFFIMNPFSEEISQSTQDLYMENYNKSYNIFINSLMIPEPNVLFTEDNSQTFMYYITCEEDIINKESDYGFKFLKSKFFEKKSKKIVYTYNLTGRKGVGLNYSVAGEKAYEKAEIE